MDRWWCLVSCINAVSLALALCSFHNAELIEGTPAKNSRIIGHHRSGGRNSHNHGWLPATATWYGSARGSGSDGGACGYGRLGKTPYGTMATAGSPVLFRNGQGCGACYEVKCIGNHACSSAGAVKVVVTDECPGGYCAFGRTHFDMSGYAFSSMAAPGRTQALLNAGELNVFYRRTSCLFPKTDVEFVVNQGATPFWFSVLIKYEDGDGDLASVDLLQYKSTKWQRMREVWGAYWCLNNGPLRAPFSIRITTPSGHRLTAYQVIPPNWIPGRTYKSHLNF